MNGWKAEDYGAGFAGLLDAGRIPELGPGSPHQAIRPKLQALDHKTAFERRLVGDAVMADACLAGVWLLHDFLDESHEISQKIETPTGGYWHGVMHRREPDFDNSRYWFRRVGAHPVFEQLGEAARELAKGDPAGQWIPPRGWDPFRFIAACESAIGRGGPEEAFCRKIQRLEWNLLFDYSFRAAASAE